jgi:hypothetical protein
VLIQGTWVSFLFSKAYSVKLIVCKSVSRNGEEERAAVSRLALSYGACEGLGGEMAIGS